MKKNTDFSKRIKKLSDKKIDELWYLCGFIISEREENFKAIGQMNINRIRGSLDSAKKVVGNLLSETKLEEFKKNLSKVEEQFFGCVLVIEPNNISFPSQLFSINLLRSVMILVYARFRNFNFIRSSSNSNKRRDLDSYLLYLYKGRIFI